MRLLGLLILTLIDGCSARPVERAQVVVDAPHLRVMTYNVNFGGAGMDLAVAAIMEAGADIVCLQETTPQWEAVLRRDLSSVYPHMEFRHAGGAGGQGILSKFDLEEVAYVKQTPGWFPGWIVKARTSLGQVQLVNVHLRPPLAEGGSVTASAYLGTGSIRREEVQILSQKLEAGTAAIIRGGFQ
ncbi:MAG TPA: endonuclease/exonuclease/phosphatase family protein [Tepidisphaeraceae bacterium]|jgi:exonuclease III|nr:endonuclease/exonuclease/phosphatase family protein [Tepidisphaeraceae bacterium]